jgi:hypothetical protein
MSGGDRYSYDELNEMISKQVKSENKEKEKITKKDKFMNDLYRTSTNLTFDNLKTLFVNQITPEKDEKIMDNKDNYIYVAPK